MTAAALRSMLGQMRISQVVFFFALGGALMWSGLRIVYGHPILAGVLFPIGVLFLFLAGAFVVRGIREQRGHAQGPDSEGSGRDQD